MKIGDKVWLFDQNRRIYPKNKTISSQPIYSEHFYRAIIDGETSRSWLIGRTKISKKNPLGIYTDAQRADAIWKEENQMKIIDKVRFCSIEQLKQIYLILADKISPNRIKV